MDMDSHRLSKVVYQFDMQQQKSQWYREICDIAKAFHLPSPDLSLSLKYDMDGVNAAALKFRRTCGGRLPERNLRSEHMLISLRFVNPRVLVKANLPRGQQNLIAKLMCGILPLEIEVRRFSGKKLEERLCTVCKEWEIEDEYHFLYACHLLKPTRKSLLKEFIPDYKRFKKLDDSVKTKILMGADNIKNTGVFSEQMFKKHKDIL